jgi:hypothetical protein
MSKTYQLKSSNSTITVAPIAPISVQLVPRPEGTHVHWDDSALDNEYMNKKKSNST